MVSFIVSRRLMKRAVIIVCWFCVIVTGVFLRFDDLASRPFHADEATGARITARRMEPAGGRFDPKHYHGPLLADLTIPLCKLRGEGGWRGFTKSTLRTLPAIAGSLLLFVPLLWRRRFGDAPMMLAAASMAVSPLLVYYSRMFIHESLLVLFGMLALFVFAGRPRPLIAGILLGLMFATKESFAISIIAWAGAALLLALENRASIMNAGTAALWARYWKPSVIVVLSAAITAGVFYTDGFTHPRGAIDAVRTFFVYETVDGHDKPATYYFQLLTLPHKSAGLWWFGTPLVVLAILAIIATIRYDEKMTTRDAVIRFTAYAAAGHFAIYSIIAYKTPWLACLPWAHVCLLAGFAVVDFRKHALPMKVALVSLTVFCLASQFRQARFASGRLASDERNPFAYVPTRRDVESLESWLRQLGPAGALEPVAVVGGDYWPLPWYLRDFAQIGYWKSPVPELAGMPLVFAMPETAQEVTAMLGSTHTPLPRGLRAEVPLLLLVRNDVWKKWMER
jgi:uncharacterized protein (TIGR03663 family)